MAIDKHNIKNKFRSEENLPEEFSWDNMEKGIYDKMNTKKSRRPMGIIIFSAIALSLIIIAGAILYLNSGDKFNKEPKSIVDNSADESIISEGKPSFEVKPEVEKLNKSPLKAESKRAEKPFVIKKEYGKAELSALEKTKPTENFDENKTINNTSANVDRGNKIKHNELVNPSNTQTSIGLTNENEPVENEKVTHNENENKIIQEKILVEAKNQIQSDIVISNIESKIFFLIYDSNRKIPFIETLNSTVQKQGENQLKNSIFITGGLLSSISNYGDSPLDNIKSKFEHERIGYSFGIGYNRDISNKISLTTGLDHFTLRNILDYKETTSYSEQRENLLLSMDINTITGDTIKSYGTGTVTGKQIRTVLHYNTHKIISIPLIVSYTIQKSKFNYTAGLGPVLNYNLYAKGRTINAIDDFQTIDKTYYKSLTYGMNARIVINYFISKNYLIGLNLNYTAPFNKWNTQSEFSLSRSVLGSNLSVGYRF